MYYVLMTLEGLLTDAESFNAAVHERTGDDALCLTKNQFEQEVKRGFICYDKERGVTMLLVDGII